MNAIAVILAAGKSQKFDLPKAVLEYEKGRSFLRSLASSFRKAGCAVLAVVGHRADEVRMNNPDVEAVESPDWEKGQLAAARVGIEAALEHGADTILLHPVDMPTFRASTVKSLLAKAEGADAVVPEFEGVAGKPLVLSRAGAERLLGFDPSITLDAAIARLQVKRVATKDPGVMVNLNSADIYERIFGFAPRAAPPPKKRGKAAAEQTEDIGADSR